MAPLGDSLTRLPARKWPTIERWARRSGAQWALAVIVALALVGGGWLLSPLAQPVSLAALAGSPGCDVQYWALRTSQFPYAGRSTPTEDDTILPTEPVSKYFYTNPPTAYANDTLADALHYVAGDDLDGGRRILLRSAVAAFLSAADDRVQYPMARADFVPEVDATLEGSSRSDMMALAAKLDQGGPACPP